MQLHALYTETILSRIAAFRDLARVAEAHHERLDGEGYPHGLTGKQVTREMRIITTADIFDALTADRPYRPSMSIGEALSIMSEMVGSAIDGDCLDALKSAMDRTNAAVAAAPKRLRQCGDIA